MRRFLLACLLLSTLTVLLSVPLMMAIGPSGAGLSPIGNETAPADAAGSHASIAGNVTEMDISGFTTTQTWQGYYGNVTGTIQLTDANDNVLYNWSVADASGEVYASTNDSLIWGTIMCFNFTADGTFSDDSGNAGNTSQFGLNLTQLESNFNLAPDDMDGVNETFNFTIGGNGHDLFYTNNYDFTDSECLHTKVYSSTGPTADQYEEALLYESTTQSVVFASILEEASTIGFDNADHDFEMLVLEDGHGINTATTTYYFYVELE